MFERIELSEYIYEGILEPSPTTYSKTSECSYNHRKRYVHHNKDRSQLSCLIHGPGHSSYQDKVLGGFGTNYVKDRPTKYCRQYPATKKRF